MSPMQYLTWKRKPASKELVKRSGSLPDDILDYILHQLEAENISWKAGVARVCRSWYTVAIPLLYETVEPLSMRAMSRLRSTVREHPSLAIHIRTLIFPCLELETSTMISFGTESGWMRQWKPTVRHIDWLRTHRAQTEVTIYSHSRRKTFIDGKSMCMLLEWFTEVAASCTRLKTLQLPTVDLKVPKNIFASILTPVKHLVLVQLHAEEYGTLSDEILAKAINVETLTISGAFSNWYRRNSLDAFVDASFFPKLHTLNVEQFTSPELVIEVIEQHAPKLNHLTLWPKSGTSWPTHAPGSSDTGGLVHIKRLTLVLNYHESFQRILSLRGLASLTCLEINIYTPRYIPDILHRLPPTLKDLIISNLAWLAGDPNTTYNDLLCLHCDTSTMPQLYPALRSVSILWRVCEPQMATPWKTLASDLRELYDLVGIKFRMELIPCDKDLPTGSATAAGDRHRWTRI